MKHMKHILSLMLGCGVILGAARLGAAEWIPKTNGPLTIDGRLDEPVWRAAKPVEVCYRGSKQGDKSADKRMIALYAWDGDYLYIGYETFDSNLVALGSDRTEGPAERPRPGALIHHPEAKVDVVEFFLSFGDEHFMWEIHHNASNQFNDIFCIVPDPKWPIAASSLATYGIIFNDFEWLRDDPPHTLAHAVHLKPKADGAPSTVNDPSDVDTGYTAEIRIPWRALGIPRKSETWLQEKPKRIPGPWNLEGQKLSLLAVFQDGDLPERYHHSSPTRKPDWFHKTQPDWPVYEFMSAAEGGDVTAIRGILSGEEAGPGASAAIDSLRKSGISAALAAATLLDENKPAEAERLFEIIAAIAKCRRMHPEVLRMYHPAAYELFHTPTAAEAQQPLAVGLEWKAWPRSLPEAMVRAAPLPTIGWLTAQIASPSPELGKLRLIFPALGWWLGTDHERQYADEFRRLAAACAAHPAITADAASAAALLKLIAEARAVAAGDWVIQMLDAPEEELRRAAANALARIAGEGAPVSADFQNRALAAWLSRVRIEQAPAVLAKLAEAGEAWPRSREVGQALSEAFGRTADPEAKRSILFAVANTEWPDRQALIRQTLEHAAGGVLGAALDAAAVHPDASYLPAIRELLAERPDASPQLIDAIGAAGDTAALGQLLDWLSREKNPALRMKLILAIDRVPGEVSDRILTDLLAKVAEPLQADLLCRIAGQRTLPGGTRFLAGLAEDVTAPVSIRARAIWALGHYADAEARESLRRLSAETPRYFPEWAAERLIPEPLEQARLFIDLARLRQGDQAVGEEVVRRFNAATPATQVEVLQALAQIRIDSPLITTGLQSGDYAVVEAAARAAGAADPAKYAALLERIRRAPFVSALLTTGLDARQLPAALDEAIKGGSPASATP
jgi:hypothetical protein